ncbi:FAD-dependent oxidoreductase [Patescibacteria group bacterium]|nr:FAD-dependent oxidoreductase [Patescibacteria group bacterium]
MRIAVIGAGFTGLTAAFELTKKGHKVQIFEKDGYGGGLASGVRRAVADYPDEWEWDLDCFYHHWFTGDREILDLVAELGLSKRINVLRPTTATWINNRFWQLDSPWSLLRFSPLPVLSRFRMGCILAYLKYLQRTSGVSWMEKLSAKDWLSRMMGEKAYRVAWESLFIGKFGQDYRAINLAWFWARVNKRTSRLVYFEGGFGDLVEILIEKIREKSGEIAFNRRVREIFNSGQGIWLEDEDGKKEGPFDRLIFTGSLPTVLELMHDLPEAYQNNVRSQRMLGALVLILALDKPFMPGVYWLNIGEEDWPFLSVVEHTNFVDKAHYGNKHLVYVGCYLPDDDPRIKMGKEELAVLFAPYLQRINPQITKETITTSSRWLFRNKYAQPVVGLRHSEKIAPLRLPTDNRVYVATMSQIYPWDRGVNYAVEMGKRVSALIDEGSLE